LQATLLLRHPVAGTVACVPSYPVVSAAVLYLANIPIVAGISAIAGVPYAVCVRNVPVASTALNPVVANFLVLC
jgi:hypothetical protein